MGLSHFSLYPYWKKSWTGCLSVLLFLLCWLIVLVYRASYSFLAMNMAQRWSNISAAVQTCHERNVTEATASNSWTVWQLDIPICWRDIKAYKVTVKAFITGQVWSSDTQKQYVSVGDWVKVSRGIGMCYQQCCRHYVKVERNVQVSSIDLFPCFQGGVNGVCPPTVLPLIKYSLCLLMSDIPHGSEALVWDRTISSSASGQSLAHLTLLESTYIILFKKGTGIRKTKCQMTSSAITQNWIKSRHLPKLLYQL